MRRGVLVGLAVLALASCGDDDDDAATTTDAVTTTSAAVTTTTAAPSTSGATTTTEATGTTAATTTTEATTTTAPAVADAVAVWPAADVVFAEPADAAADFVENVLDVPATLGEFRPGDSRSGEIDVFSPGEGAYAEPSLRGTLEVRQLGPDNGWFVTGAVSDDASIAEPAALDVVSPGPLTVAGEALGFEANVVVFAFPQGAADDELDRVVTLAGAMFEPEPYTVDLDLSGAEPGSSVGIVVRGGAGLETDPGAFAAIAVVIEG